MMAIVQILEWPELGFQYMAECEHCLDRGGDIAGCHECNYKGYRRLTEEEEKRVG